eukprot:TRINITY_DN862_c0_g1_i1.p1 TRINITY_DN862_c0_g1~~TRINITY_DN862_c0_g1_i1.p1  ORF type:complete len:1309 (+),score=309.38 TRINITY_DN862_c0_g1_i1:1049-4975(+)
MNFELKQEHLGSHFTEDLLKFLFTQLTDKKDVQTRAGTLGILRQLINRINEHLDDKKEFILKELKTLSTFESNLIVKKKLVLVVTAMVPQGYFQQAEYAQHLIEFLLKNCCLIEPSLAQVETLGKNKKTAESVSGQELKTMSEKVLCHFFLNNLDKTDRSLWPFLFEPLLSTQYNEALLVVTKCLSHIALTKRENEEEDYNLDFENVNVPKPCAIIARLIVLLCAPLRKGSLGIQILECLRGLAPLLLPPGDDGGAPAMWDTALPKLVAFIEKTKSDSWDANKWEELTLKLLAETIKRCNDDEWTLELGEKMTEQLDFYKNDQEIKKSAMNLLGLVLQKSNKREFIKSKLDVMFLTLDHNAETSRVGCGQAFGFTAAAHLDLTLERIQEVMKAPAAAPSSRGFFSFIDSKKDVQATPQTNTALLCLGYMTAFSPKGQITSRLEVTTVPLLRPYLTTRSPLLQEHIIKCLDLIGSALHPNSLRTAYKFTHRDEFLKAIVEYMAPSVPVPDIPWNIRILGLQSARTLVRLDPLLPEIEKELLEKTSNIYLQLGEPVPLSELAKQQTDRKQQKLNIDVESYQKFSRNYNRMVTAIIATDPATSTFNRILKNLEHYVRSNNIRQRDRMVFSINKILQKLVKHKTPVEEEDGEEATKKTKKEEYEFENIGYSIGVLIPRVTDPEESIRLAAHESIEHIIELHMMLTQPEAFTEEEAPTELQTLQSIRDRLSSKEMAAQFGVVQQTTLTIAPLFPEQELSVVVLEAIKGLSDSEASSSSGTCVFINTLYKARGQELLPKVGELVRSMLDAMSQITEEKTLNGTLNTFKSLAASHLLPVVDELLNSPIPHSIQTKRAAIVIAKDENLAVNMINYLILILNNSQLIEGETNVSTLSMSATCLLSELLESEELEVLIRKNFLPSLWGTLLLRFGTTIGYQPKTASEQAVGCLRNFLNLIHAHEITDLLNNGDRWKQLETQEYPHLVIEITSLMCKLFPDKIGETFDFLYPFLKGNFPGQRVSTAAAFSEFINNLQQHKDLLQKVINSFLLSLIDETIKIFVLRGLGNLVSCGQQQIDRLAPTIIDALMCSIDDANETLALEAMNGLAKIFVLVDESRVSHILVNICHRIRPAFDKKNDNIRAASFHLFGNLWKFGNGEAADTFYDQLQNNLPTLLLHLTDDVAPVAQACRQALRKMAPLFRNEEVSSFLSRVLEDSRQISFEDFYNELTKLLTTKYRDRVNYYVMTCIEYFKSSWTTIRCNAALIVGLTLKNLPLEIRKQITVNPAIVTDALVTLIKDRNPEVRAAASKALGKLHAY